MKLFKKIIAGVTATVCILCAIPTVHAASVYDTIVPTKTTKYNLNYSKTARLADIVGTYTKGDTVNSAHAFTIAASPKAVSIGIADGDSIYSKNTLSDMIKKYDVQGKHVIGAINADFFSTTTGTPLGVQIDGGKIYSTNNAEYDKEQGRVSIGFNADGTTVFGVPEFEITVSVDGYQLKADRFNSYPNWLGDWKPVTVLNSDYGTKTYWVTGKAYDVIVLKQDSDFTIDSDVTCHYDNYYKNLTEPIPIEKGKVYIVAAAGYFAGFNPPIPALMDASGAFVYDDISYIGIYEKTGAWKNAVAAVGAGNLLVNYGEMRYPSTYDSSIRGMKTSRSAFGVKADGTYVFYAAERSNAAGTSGVPMDAVAQAMYNAGCVFAVNLDGGGSTTIMADTGSGIKTQNVCQDGSQRRISNAILLLSDETAPVIIEDFETEKTFTETYSGTNLVSGRIDTSYPYTGASALAIDYTLAGVGDSVTVEFDAVDISAHTWLMAALDTGSTGVTVAARIKVGEKYISRVLTDDGDGYTRSQINVSGAESLVGFTLSFNEGAANRGTVFIDRIVGYSGYTMKDTDVPELSSKVEGGVIKVTSSEPLFSSGIDPNGAEIYINDGELIRGNKVNTAGIADSTKINRAKIYAVDVVGNRTVTYNLFKTADYSAPQPFADMNDSKWDAQALRYCYENGIISGFKENGTLYYKGSQNVTRAQFCVMIVSQKKLDINRYLNVKLPYEDIDDIPSWAFPYIRAAYAEGIMTGSNTATGVAFYPNNDITRAEAASALDRLIVKDTRLTRVVTYRDEKDIGNWAKGFVASASTQGLFEGDVNGNFYPNRNLTRSEAAVLMSKL